MSTPTHTPGPWTAQKAIKGTLIYAHNPDRKIADVHVCFAEVAPSEGEANARLIAAAPELLEELQDLVRRIERDNLHTTQGVKLAKAKQAIAKAEGRA